MRIKVFRDVKIVVSEKDDLYPYLDNIAHMGNNLYNAALFRLRQVMTGIFKEEKDITPNEKGVLDEIRATLPRMIRPKSGKPFLMPTKKTYKLSYYFLNSLLLNSNNPDYCCESLPRQTAQQILRVAVRDMKAFYGAKREYKKDPGKFTGEPKLPHYKKPGGKSSFYMTNQECYLEYTDGKAYLKLPKAEGRRYCVGGYVQQGWRLKQITVVPFHNVYVMHMIVNDLQPEVKVKEESERICAIDLGVDNFAAIASNISTLPCMLLKGGAVKNANQWYNKRMALYKSEQTKGTTNKFVPTPQSDRLGVWRENYMNDFMHKCAKLVIEWCLDNKIDTVVVGVNKEFKQNAELGKVNNQNFVQIPWAKFRWDMEYLCKETGLIYIEQEESYTSKASFIDNDPIPVYGSKDIPVFSGKRRPTAYKGNKSVTGFRGLYRTADGTIVNADLNAAANIGRKAFPDKFRECSLLTMPIIYKYPDKHCIKDITA